MNTRTNREGTTGFSNLSASARFSPRISTMAGIYEDLRLYPPLNGEAGQMVEPQWGRWKLILLVLALVLYLVVIGMAVGTLQQPVTAVEIKDVGTSSVKTEEISWSDPWGRPQVFPLRDGDAAPQQKCLYLPNSWGSNHPRQRSIPRFCSDDIQELANENPESPDIQKGHAGGDQWVGLDRV